MLESIEIRNIKRLCTFDHSFTQTLWNFGVFEDTTAANYANSLDQVIPRKNIVTLFFSLLVENIAKKNRNFVVV